jgi:hypothetical protein
MEKIDEKKFILLATTARRIWPQRNTIVCGGDFIRPYTTKKIVFRHLQFATCTVTVHVANCWPRASGHVNTRGGSG